MTSRESARALNEPAMCAWPMNIYVSGQKTMASNRKQAGSTRERMWLHGEEDWKTLHSSQRSSRKLARI